MAIGDLPASPSADSAATDLESPAHDLSIVGALNVLLQQRALIAWCAFATLLLVVVVVLLTPRTYATTSSFIPQARRTNASLAGIAAQFGLAVPGADPGQSPAFYSDLVMTREIMGAVVDGRFFDPALGRRDSVTLVDVLGDGPKTPALRREQAIRKLREDVSADVSLKSGTIELTVKQRYPMLSMQVNRRILDLLNEFNLRKRQTQAAFERRFVERRLDEVRAELRVSEDRLQEFLQGNRDYRNSPSLTFQHDRLEREVSMGQQLYTSLAQAFEQAKIDEIRDSPLITIIEEPTVPVLPTARGLLRKSALALLGGLLLGVCLAFARYAVRQGRAGNADELSRFRALAAETMRTVLRPWRSRRRAATDGRAAS